MAVAAIPDELWGIIEDGLKQGFSDLTDYVTDFPGFVASTDDKTPWFEATRAIAQSACQQWQQGSSLPVGPDSVWSGICDPYLESQGLGKTPGGYVPPFTGGQCATNYTVTWSYRIQPGNIVSTPSRSGILGPISSITGRSEPCTTQFGPGFTTFSIAVDANGNEIGGFGNGLCQVGIDSITYEGAVVTRDDGQPDTCGDPPADIYVPREPSGGTPPPGWGSPTIVVETPVGDFEVEVVLNPDGTITVSSGDNEVTIDPTAIVQDDPVADSRGVADESKSETGGLDGDSGGEDSDDPGRKLIGVQVQLLDTSDRSRVEFGSVPLFYSAGWVAWNGEEGGLEFPDNRVICEDQWFPAPDTAIGYRWKSSKGFRFKVTPYYEE